MLQQISWTQYWVFMLLAGTVYYLAIWLLYFKGRLLFPSALAKRLTQKGVPGTDAEDIQIVLAAIAPVFHNKINKSELLWGLQLQTRNYLEITDPGFHDAINRFIVSESLAKCSIRLDSEDLSTLWK